MGRIRLKESPNRGMDAAEEGKRAIDPFLMGKDQSERIKRKKPTGPHQSTSYFKRRSLDKIGLWMEKRP